MKIRVLTFNAWSDHPRHPSWSSRRSASTAVFSLLQPDILGGQEYSIAMLRDVEQICPEWEWIGAGRDDGREQGEFTPIFFKRQRFQRLDGGTFWLSPDETFMTPGWKAFCRRTVTWAHLQARQQQFFVFNTHFDHVSRQARAESAKLLLRKVTALAGNHPVVVTGDLNCRPGSRPWRTLTQPDDPALVRLRDAREHSETPPQGPVKTWRGIFGGFGAGRIDHIFCSDKVRVLGHRTVDDPRIAAASDHRPVLADLLIPGNTREGRATVAV